MQEYISLISLVMGLTSFIGGLVLWYRGAVEKRFAAERDFQHLKRNQEQLAGYLKELDDSMEERSQVLMQQFLEIKGMLYGILGERTSGGSIRLPRGD